MCFIFVFFLCFGNFWPRGVPGPFWGSPRPSGGRPQMCVLSLFSDLCWNLKSKTHMCPFKRRVFSTKLLSNVRFIFVFRLILKFKVKNSHVPIQSSIFIVKTVTLGAFLSLLRPFYSQSTLLEAFLSLRRPFYSQRCPVGGLFDTFEVFL